MLKPLSISFYSSLLDYSLPYNSQYSLQEQVHQKIAYPYRSSESARSIIIDANNKTIIMSIHHISYMY